MKTKALYVMLSILMFSSLIYAQEPNIILIIADDMGWNQVSSNITNNVDDNDYGSDFYETPIIDQLASEGIAFPYAYVNGGNCAPTRAALLSGQFAARPHNNVFTVYDLNRGNTAGNSNLIGPDMGLALNAEDQIPASAITIAETLKTAGYTTGHWGKFHSGEDEATNASNNAATDQGFDFNYGGGQAGGPGNYFSDGSTFGDNIGPELDVYAGVYTEQESIALSDDHDNYPLTGTNKHVSDAMAEAAIDFMDANSTSPFFMHFSNFAIHGPFGEEHARPDLRAKYNDKADDYTGSMNHASKPGQAAIAEGMDQTIGRLIDYLKTTDDPRNPGHKLSENTLVYFISDNGDAIKRTPQAPLRGMKGEYYEGGIRSVTFAWSEAPWLANKGTINTTPIVAFDLYPTFVEAAGGTLPGGGYNIDGESQWQMLTNGTAMTRESMYWHHPGYLIDSKRDSRPVTVVRKGDYKLMHFYEASNYEMYHLIDDIGETINLLDGSPEEAIKEIANDMITDMRNHLIGMSSPLPTYRSDGTTVPLPHYLVVNSKAGCQPPSTYVAYWDFDSLSNTNDVSNSGHNAVTVSGPLTYDTVDFIEGDQSIIFGGLSEITYSDGTFLNEATTSRSVSAWIKPTGLTGTQVIFEQGGSNNGLTLRLNGSNIEARIVGSSTFDQISASYPIDGDWHHVALVFDGANTTLSIYIDGALATTNTSSFSALFAHTNAGGIGGVMGSDSYGSEGSTGNFTGKMDAIAIYDHALSATEIESNICNSGPGGISDNLGLWLMANTNVENTSGDPAENGDIVLNWLDQSVLGCNTIQAESDNRPTFSDTAINFNPIINFDGDDLLESPIVSTNAEMSVFTVAEGISGTQKQIFNLNGGSNVILEYNASNSFRSRMYDGDSDTGEIITTSSSIGNGIPFLSNYDVFSSSNSQLFINGINVGTDATNNYSPTNPIINIGGHPNNDSKRWNGGIAEMIVYNRSLNSNERNQIESYLAIKYGFTLGVNGTSQDYVDSEGNTIWDISDNADYNYNITGIGKDYASELDQKQSKSILSTNDGTATDDITIGLKGIASSNERKYN